MKIATREIRAFLAAPPPTVRAVLVYGPDGGLVRERARLLAATVVDDPGDPFRVAQLGAADLKSDPARVHDEAASVSMTGGRRVVQVRADGETLPPGPFESLLADPAADALVVVEAGDLPPKAPLRKLFEGADEAAALPCYGDEGETLADVVRETLAEGGLTVSGDALRYLCDHLGDDRMVTRGELEKIVLYKSGAGEGDMAALDRALARLYQQGATPVAALRAAQRHLQRLHLAAALVEDGQSPDQAVGALRPPPFFKVRPRLVHQLRLWSRKRLAQALDMLFEAEAACKRTGAPAEAICGRALFMLATAAARARRR
jgi:DNA polymerase-3 subunit delta